MKKLIPIFCFILFSNLTFSQIPLKKMGDFYELNDLWKRDSVSVKQLINKFDLHISKLDTVQFFKQFDLTKKLQSEYSHIAYIYTLDKKTNSVTMKSIVKQRANPIINKYVMIVCFDENTDRKVIDILVF